MVQGGNGRGEEKGVQISLNWKPAHLETVVVLLSFSGLYLLYHYSLLLSGLKALSERLIKKGFDIHSSIAQKGSGVILLGLLPFITGTIILNKQPHELGLSISIPPLYLIPVFVICALLFPVLLINSKTPEALRKAKEGSGPSYSPVSSLFWIPYIIAYEFCMRGYLLFSLSKVMGGWPAIATVTAIYTAVHLPKGKGEAAGSLIMGVIFGLFTLATRSIVIPVIIHVYIALTTDLLAMRAKTR